MVELQHDLPVELPFVHWGTILPLFRVLGEYLGRAKCLAAFAEENVNAEVVVIVVEFFAPIVVKMLPLPLEIPSCSSEQKGFSFVSLDPTSK